MPTKPEDILTLAEQINADPAYDNEPSRRAAIGRAYYSIYHQTKEVVFKYGLPQSTLPATGSHQKEFNRLIQCEPARTKEHWSNIKSIGVMAARILNPARTLADYRLDIEITKLDATEAIERAKLIQEKVRSVIHTPEGK